MFAAQDITVINVAQPDDDSVVVLYRVEDGETASCTVVFFIVYFFMMAGVTWLVILAYSWHVSFKKLQTGSVDDKLKGKIAYFHIAAWALPLICAIIAMSLQKVPHFSNDLWGTI